MKRKVFLVVVIQLTIVLAAFLAGSQHRKFTSWHTVDNAVWERWLVSKDGFIRLSTGHLDGVLWQVATEMDWLQNVTSLQYCRSNDSAPEEVVCAHNETSPLRQDWEWLFEDAPFQLPTVHTPQVEGEGSSGAESDLIHLLYILPPLPPTIGNIPTRERM